MARKPTTPEAAKRPSRVTVKVAPGVAVPDAATPAPPPARKPLWTHLYFQVLVAIVLGAVIGHLFPSTTGPDGVAVKGLGEQLKPLGDAFIRLVKMIIAPVIFLTVATGIAHLRDVAKVGKVAGKAFAYFLTFSTLALIIGLVVANVVRPGAGMNVDPATLDTAAVSGYVSRAHESGVVAFLMNIIPETVVGAFAGGEILQVLFFSILFGLSLAIVGDRAQPVVTVLESASEAFFKLVAILMKAAPIGAFGAFAFTIGRYGIESIVNLAALVATFYLTSILFVVVVLGLVARANGFSIFRLIRYLKEELLLVLGTSSSEAALPKMFEQLDRFGVPRRISGFMLPLGYSFNLDGSMMYMSFATIFIAQAYGIDLSIGTQILILLTLMISSKGIAAVPRASLVVITGTLAQFGLPVEGVAIILAIDQFLDMGRTATNVVGNAVATSVITKWEGMLEVPEPAEAERPHAPSHTPHHGTRGLDLRDTNEAGDNKPAADNA